MRVLAGNGVTIIGVKVASPERQAPLDPVIQQRIYAEEIYRAQVRGELEKLGPRKSLAATLWTTVNSAFVLFVFGSVVLSLISFLYQSKEHERAAAKEREQFMVNAATEVEHRSWLADDNVPETSKITDHTQFNAHQYLTLAPNAAFASLYPEFAQLSAISVLVELRRVCATAPACPNAEDALEQIDQLGIVARDWPSMSIDERIEGRLRAAEAIQSLRNALWLQDERSSGKKNPQQKK